MALEDGPQPLQLRGVALEAIRQDRVVTNDDLPPGARLLQVALQGVHLGLNPRFLACDPALKVRPGLPVVLMHEGGWGREECQEEFKEEVGFATLTCVQEVEVQVLMLLDGEALRPAATAYPVSREVLGVVGGHLVQRRGLLKAVRVVVPEPVVVLP
eukprot:CAMPEP_0196647384 /NCGR_PEP_ID=MMETSP1085-20130531/11844_1 /TAXON_ID=41879 ORGANISM="Pycnococcus sp, Strain CCMP1998" /NCGR_SAMPLE_ID=MMETSP1085 /ASSEMBLY_ACC=CAM_ASM_000807 /LENGTH=156 /DNA_ID=CAMNT_0041977115 /DNA_START=193 /DNA_END=663 /DNA_ORIENTATION=+